MILNPIPIWTNLSHVSKWHGSFRGRLGMRPTAGNCADKIKLNHSTALISLTQKHPAFAFQLLSLPNLTSWMLNMQVAFLALSSPTLPITTQLLVSSTNFMVF